MTKLSYDADVSKLTILPAICKGSGLATRAAILDGCQATTNKHVKMPQAVSRGSVDLANVDR